MQQEKDVKLVRGLTLYDTIALVIGTVIGTGVFLKTSVMAQDAGSPAMVLTAWVAAGLLSLAGALTYAELGAMLPHAGGEYVYLRHAYGDLFAFLYGWMRVVVASSGSIAILGVGLATFLSAIFPMNTIWAEAEFTLLYQKIDWQFGVKQVVAVTLIMCFSIINCLAVSLGGKVQSFLTLLKIAGIAFLVIGVFLFSKNANWSHLLTPSDQSNWSGASAFGMAMLAALWAYDGWNNMPMAAGEVSNPGRNVPKALIFGMVAVMLIYCLTNLAYFYALDFGNILNANSTKYRDALPVATKAAQTAFGEDGGKLISIAFILSAMGAINGSILTAARVPYAMAVDGLFFEKAKELHAKTRVPVYSILLQAIWASVLAISGTFDQLTDYVVFASWIFYGLVTSSIFVLRRKMPDAERPYRTLGYPIVPMIFIGVAIWLLINTLVNRPVESLAGLVLIACGIPLYLLFKRDRNQSAI
jgi:APA family basic amino acid/polyamine antiporter